MCSTLKIHITRTQNLQQNCYYFLTADFETWTATDFTCARAGGQRGECQSGRNNIENMECAMTSHGYWAACHAFTHWFAWNWCAYAWNGQWEGECMVPPPPTLYLSHVGLSGRGVGKYVLARPPPCSSLVSPPHSWYLIDEHIFKIFEDILT
jgi:hypothetical protein